MQEQPAYAVGLDVGTTTVRAVVGHIDEAGKPTILGIGEAPNSGMRKGAVVNIVNTAQAIDKALEAAERMSGQHIHSASVSINGPHIVGVSSKGVVAVPGGHDIEATDLTRAEEAATVMQMPANREILQVSPRSFTLDDQDNIKDPIGMRGVRLEVNAHVITTLSPHIRNLEKACEMTQTTPHRLVVAGLAASKVALSRELTENGVVLVDIGGSTTSVVVFEEGDLQHIAVLPIGSNNITNDLAIGLRTDISVAEDIKLHHASMLKRDPKEITIGQGADKLRFSTEDIDMIVDARLEELFELVNKELASIGRAAKLPGGVVLSGGGAAMDGIVEYAKDVLHLPARVVKMDGFSGVADALKQPAFATAVGLMLADLENTPTVRSEHGGQPGGGVMQVLSNLPAAMSNLLKRFKS